jgi:hypothetical protein
VPATVILGGRSIPCSAENLSRSGVLLVGSIPEPIGDRLDLALKTPNGTFEIKLNGRVVRTEDEQAPGEKRVALAFGELDSATQDALEIFLARLIEAPTPGPFDGLRQGAAPHEIKKALEAVPLQQRIGMAQRAELKQRELLRQDQHPAVLESLFRNANLTLPEARALAGSTFLQAGTIEALANDPRFRADEELRMILATHPRVPVPTAERITAGFNVAQLKRLVARPGLNPALRDKLSKKVARG